MADVSIKPLSQINLNSHEEISNSNKLVSIAKATAYDASRNIHKDTIKAYDAYEVDERTELPDTLKKKDAPK